mgnify:CR=1 FL=1
MSSRNNRFEFGLASSEDNRQILEIFESIDFKGNISVLFTRRPDPCESLMNDGETAVIPVIREVESGKICAVGCCIIRKAFINGEVRNTGYLTGLKVLPEYRRKLPNISDVYSFLHEQTRDKVDIYYTTILKDNINAQKLLEKRRKNMPQYDYAGEYTVYCFTTGKSVNSNSYTFKQGGDKALEEFYKRQLSTYNFSPVNMDLYGLTLEDFYTLSDVNGEIIAACAVWNQQSYKQYIIKGYGGIYRHLKHIPLSWIGYPNLPKENLPANYASIALLMVKDNSEELARYFVKKVAQHSKKYDFLMLGLFQNHPLNGAFKRIRHIKYQSKLYTVNWNINAIKPDQRPVNLEVGLL